MEIKRDLATDLVVSESISPYWRNQNGDLMSSTEAREGWAHAIRRAIAAEAENERLRAELQREKLWRNAWKNAAILAEEKFIRVQAEVRE